MMNQNKDLRYKVKCLTFELEDKNKELKHVSEELKELKTQMFTYQRLVRELKTQKDGIQIEMEAMREQLQIEVDKRLNIEK
jgi:predicted  nucleic acid-binding Zn-ribbon protein